MPPQRRSVGATVRGGRDAGLAGLHTTIRDTMVMRRKAVLGLRADLPDTCRPGLLSLAFESTA
jgi:hypothetical protein